MFAHAKLFNSDISNWNVGKVTTMDSMFRGAASFNRDISKWNVGKVTDMRSMFLNARAFTQTLCGSWPSSKADKAQMFVGSPGKIGDVATCRACALIVFSHPYLLIDWDPAYVVVSSHKWR